MSSPSNLVFGVISTSDNTRARCAAAIQGTVIELSKYSALRKEELLPLSNGIDLEAIFDHTTLNAFAELDPELRRGLRIHLEDQYDQGKIPKECLVSLSSVNTHMPMSIGNYVDFYCSLEHAQNCSSLVGGDVGSNFYFSPLCYNGRASSIVLSGTDITRPHGITFDDNPDNKLKANYRPTKKLDYELEIGYFVSKPVPRGERMSIAEAPKHIFGFVMLNDWSSRDVQAFEMRPLGPFHSKGFATSISQWIVPTDALEPFACPSKHDHSEMTVDNLRWDNAPKATFNVNVKATLIRNNRAYTIAESQLHGLYWTPFQQLTHLASAGCGMLSGDLVGTGTISGEDDGSRGCLFEATRDSTQPKRLDDEQNLTYLMDFDEIILEGYCVSENGKKVLSFGECRGRIIPAR